MLQKLCFFGLVLSAATLNAAMIDPGAPMRSEHSDHGNYSLVQGGRAPGPDGHRSDVAFYYFGDYGYYGYPWGYDYASPRTQHYFQDRGYPYDDGYYFYAPSAQDQRRISPSSHSLYRHLK